MRASKSNSAEFLISVKKVKNEIYSLQKLGFKVLFPVKTLPEFNFLKLIARDVDGFDVSNATEYKKISTLKSKRIGATSPQGSELVEIDRLSKGAALIAVHNSSQLSSVGDCKQVALRLNPYSFAGSPTASSVRFGFGKTELEKLQKSVYANPKFRGFTAHFGTAITDKNLPFDFLKSLNQILKSQKISPEILNLGGGWSKLSPGEMKFIAQAAKKFFPETEIWIEPGERLTQAAISIDAKIIEVTERDDDIFCLLNCSVEAHLRWARVQVKTDFLTTEIPAAVSLKSLFVNRSDAGPRLWFVGLTCSEGDRIGPFYLKAKSKIKNIAGKKILLENISGYALAWNREFNGIQKLNFRIGAK